MRRFDYDFLRTVLVPARFVTLVSDISSVSTRIEARKDPRYVIFDALESEALLQSARSYNKLAGGNIGGKRVAALVNQTAEPKNQAEADISGYIDALNTIDQKQDNLDFCQSDILSLHARIMPDGGGQFKESTQNVSAMVQLLLAYMGAKDDTGINPLMLIPCVVLDFMNIQPFDKGNSRMAMLLTRLLLYKNGYDVWKYVSLEQQIESQKENCEKAFKKSSENWSANGNDYVPFIECFLSMLDTGYNELEKKFADKNDKKQTKAARIEEVVLNSPVPISKKEICSILPDVSESTVGQVLWELVYDGKIERIGVNRSTRYFRK